MKKKYFKLAKKAGTALFVAACLFSLYPPFPERLAGGEAYACVWSDGSVTEESYSSAYSALAGMDGEGVLLSRGGLTGRIESEAGALYSVLERGSLADLLSCTAEGTRIDSAALYRAFSDRVWYDGDYYVWTGDGVERVSRAKRGEIVFLEGSVSARVLNETNASTVYLRSEAQVTAASFVGSGVKAVFAEAPYSERDGAVYTDTAGGKRLVAAIGIVQELVLDENLSFADEGALIACEGLVSIELPFLGSAKSPFGSGYRGEFAHLFSDGGSYRVPATLERVRVTGGRIESFAFYACPDLKEIDACGVDASEISRTAFAGMNSLKKLHTPKREVSLTGSFASYRADCGCTVYERK